jgi:topoisomerase-4 subunit B
MIRKNQMADKNITNSYTADSIQVLEGLDAVRKRPGMYIGSTNIVGFHQLVWEVVNNSTDEAMSGYGDKITVTIHKNGSITIADEGRGIPTGINKQTGQPAVHLVFSTLHAGGKFSESTYKTSAGLHGVGASVTNALSEWLDVTVYREGKVHHLRYENGGKLVTPLEVVGNTNRTGTIVNFKPDPKIFGNLEFKWDTITSHLQESAFLLNKVAFIVKDERSGLSEEFYYEKGLIEYVDIINRNKTALSKPIYFEDIYTNNDKLSQPMEIEVALQYCSDDYGETVLSYVNNLRTHDGGTHETGFRTGLTRAVNDFATEHNLLRKGVKLDGNDIREGLTAIISVRIPESILQFESQTKGKLGTNEANWALNSFIYTKLTYYLQENHEFAVSLIKKCVDAQNARIAARKAKENLRKTKKVTNNDMILSGKLTPAQSKDYKKNELFIVEGNSAGGTAKSGRDRMYQAVLPLRGKPLNTDTSTVDKMLKNEEFATLISTIGAGFGQNFDIEDAHYGKIIIMTDADYDGSHIQTLLLTFFYHYMKPLLKAGMIYIAVPPLYRVSKQVNKKLIFEYAWDDQSLEAAKEKIGPGYKITRYKGLGEMNADQLWETTLNPETRTLIRVNINDPLLVEMRVSTLMGNDANVRRKWIEENVDFNAYDTFIDEVK